jgi:salicylate hydroxylase
MIRPHTVACRAISLRRYADDSELAYLPLPGFEKVHHAPNLVAHRADLHNVLKIGAEMAGAQIHTNCKIEDIDFKNTRIKIVNHSDWIQGDVIIAADGIKSKIRKKMLALHGDIDEVRETGDAAWRIILSADQIYASNDPELIEALEKPVALRWMGPDGHIMCYPIRNHKLLNIALLHPDRPGTEESWTVKGDKKEMVEFYKTWNSRVKKLIDCIPEDEVLEWKLCDHLPLKTWIEDKVALMGDAAHPMLPYLAQGASQAVEDGAVIAACLAMIDNKAQINTALKVYELVRKERAEIVQTSAIQARGALHLRDGKEQEARDAIIRNVVKGGPNPDLQADKSFQQWCWVTFFVNFSNILS